MVFREFNRSIAAPPRFAINRQLAGQELDILGEKSGRAAIPDFLNVPGAKVADADMVDPITKRAATAPPPNAVTGDREAIVSADAAEDVDLTDLGMGGFDSLGEAKFEGGFVSLPG